MVPCACPPMNHLFFKLNLFKNIEKQLRTFQIPNMGKCFQKSVWKKVFENYYRMVYKNKNLFKNLKYF